MEGEDEDWAAEVGDRDGAGGLGTAEGALVNVRIGIRKKGREREGRGRDGTS